MEIPLPEGKKFTVGGLVATLIVLIALTTIGLVVFRVACLKYVDNYELGYKFDRITGKISVLERPGYHFKRPYLDEINTVDLRPMQVCINANQRVLNCKLVRFNPDGIAKLLEWHGRQNYDGMDTMTGGFNDILKSYAYDGTGKSCPFLTVIRELKPDDATIATPPAQPAS